MDTIPIITKITKQEVVGYFGNRTQWLERGIDADGQEWTWYSSTRTEYDQHGLARQIIEPSYNYRPALPCPTNRNT